MVSLLIQFSCFRLQNYKKKSEYANKIHFILPFTEFSPGFIPLFSFLLSLFPFLFSLPIYTPFMYVYRMLTQG